MRFFKKSKTEDKVEQPEAVIVEPVVEDAPKIQPVEKKSWAARLKDGLSRTSGQLSEGITSIFTKRKLDDDALEELEELLIRADLGAKVASRIVADFAKGKFDKEISPGDVKEELASRVAAILEPVAKQVDISPAHKPHVMLVVGVNGNGKTTTIGKMANLLKNGGWKVMMAAGDTFRAAAVGQLQVWGERVGCEVVTGVENADPASVVYRAYEEAVAQGVDILLVDTAGRLHNKQNLMAELQKIFKVLQKLNPDAPHSVVQVLDATTGQNALAQVEAFKSMAQVSGLIVTKLDGTAKGGVVVALAEKFNLPIHAIGVGEGIEDLRDFSAHDFARNLLG
ncbi:MAG: signal recognition particle-docking protein FtsY [Alphaproteobacteria bacterium]|nr:signal recognition particle-docking protein FtsY [Alphaproteobacteria bacterium]